MDKEYFEVWSQNTPTVEITTPTVYTTTKIVDTPEPTNTTNTGVEVCTIVGIVRNLTSRYRNLEVNLSHDYNILKDEYGMICASIGEVI